MLHVDKLLSMARIIYLFEYLVGSVNNITKKMGKNFLTKFLKLSNIEQFNSYQYYLIIEYSFTRLFLQV